MTAKLIIALLILAHLLSDFIFQSEEMANQKQNNYSVLAKHCIKGFGISLFLTIPYISLWLIGIEFIIYFFHFWIDLGKIKLAKFKINFLTEVKLFLFDQFLHFTVLIAAYPLLKITEISLRDWAVYINDEVLLKLFPLFKTLSMSESDWYIFILVICGYIFIWTPTSLIVEKMLDKLKDSLTREQIGFIISGDFNKEQQLNPGELIGKLERAILMTLVLSGNFTAIPIVLAAKSVARFSNFENKDFANYYIIGTFISLLIAVIVGGILNIIASLEGYNIFYML